jgi:predicted glycosyltransferase
LPRNKEQGKSIQGSSPEWFENGKTIIPETAVDGLNLIWHSELVVSGGGTMNREAAALDVPVYSIFRGKIGAVDLRLEQEGRLVLIKTVRDVFDKIPFQRRVRDDCHNGKPRKALQEIISHIEDILKIEQKSR